MSSPGAGCAAWRTPGGWNLLHAIAIDGKWLRGIGDGQVKLFAAMLHEEKVIIAQHPIPDDTDQITQVRELLDPVDLAGAVVTADAAHAQRETAAYIAGPAEDGGRESDYFLFVKGNQPGLQRAVYDLIQAAARESPDHVEIDYSHGRIIKRSMWVTDAGGMDFPHVTRAVRIRRDGYDTAGAAITRKSCTPSPAWARTGPPPRTSPQIARGQWGIESVHWVRDTAYGEDASTGYAGNGPQVMATFRNIAISLLYLAGVTEITRTLQTISRDRTRMLSYLPL